MGDVGQPNLVRLRRREVARKQMGRDWIVVATVRRSRLPRQGRKTADASPLHKLRNTGAADPAAMSAQNGLHVRRAVCA